MSGATSILGLWKVAGQNRCARLRRRLQLGHTAGVSVSVERGDARTATTAVLLSRTRRRRPTSRCKRRRCSVSMPQPMATATHLRSGYQAPLEKSRSSSRRRSTIPSIFSMAAQRSAGLLLTSSREFDFGAAGRASYRYDDHQQPIGGAGMTYTKPDAYSLSVTTILKASAQRTRKREQQISVERLPIR